jgi:hypothetical protein
MTLSAPVTAGVVAELTVGGSGCGVLLDITPFVKITGMVDIDLSWASYDFFVRKYGPFDVYVSVYIGLLEFRYIPRAYRRSDSRTC